jgi:hypothetical protein
MSTLKTILREAFSDWTRSTEDIRRVEQVFMDALGAHDLQVTRKDFVKDGVVND